MNTAYVIWIEHLNAPIIQGQVIEVLRKISKKTSIDKLYFFAFQSIYFILLHYQELRKMSKELRNDNIDLIIVPTISLPLFFATWHVVPLIFLQSFPTLLVLTYIKKIDILHCRSYPITLAAITVKKVNKRLRIIFDPRSDFPEENITASRWSEESLSYKLWKNLEKRFLKDSDVTIAIANTYIEHFKKIAPTTRFVIIPNNVDVERFKQNKIFRERFRKKKGIRNDEILFCYCGTLGGGWHKPEIYAEFMVRLRKLDVDHRFLFITPSVNILRNKLKELGVRPEEYFAVSSSFLDVPKYLSVADFGLFLLGRVKIAMAIKTAEYLAMGLPVVTNSNGAGAKEVVEQHDVGLVLEDLENINLEEIESIIQKKDQLSLNCRKLACERFSTVEVAKQYVNVYDILKR